MICEYSSNLVPLYIYIKVPWHYCLIPLLYHGTLRAYRSKRFHYIYSAYWWMSLVFYWCLLHLKAVLVHNWCSRSDCLMPMGKVVECAIIDLKVAVIPLKDFHLAFNWISSAGSWEPKRADLTCLTLSVPCHLSVVRCHSFSSLVCKSCLSLCDESRGRPSDWFCQQLVIGKNQ